MCKSKVSFQFTFLINLNAAHTRADHRLKTVSMPPLRNERTPKAADIRRNPEPFVDEAISFSWSYEPGENVCVSTDLCQGTIRNCSAMIENPLNSISLSQHCNGPIHDNAWLQGANGNSSCKIYHPEKITEIKREWWKRVVAGTALSWEVLHGTSLSLVYPPGQDNHWVPLFPVSFCCSHQCF